MNLDDIKKVSTSVSLNEDERMHLWQSLMNHIEKNPAMVPSPHGFFSQRSYMSIIALGVIVLLFAGTSVSFAAERSLPGDALYPIKIGVNEKVRSYFAFSDRSKAKLEADFAAERLVEAEKIGRAHV